MKISTSIITLFLLIQACVPRDASGRYGECGRGYFACTQIQLNPDSTFTYGYWYDVGGEWTFIDGRWTRQGSRIIIHGNMQPADELASVTESRIEGQDSVTIRCSFSDSSEVMFWISVQLDDSDSKLCDILGLCSFKLDHHPTSIGVKELSSRKVQEYLIKDTLANHFDVVLRPAQSYYITDDTLRLTRKGLLHPIDNRKSRLLKKTTEVHF